MRTCAVLDNGYMFKGTLINPRTKNTVTPKGGSCYREGKHGPVQTNFHRRIHKVHAETMAGRLYYEAYIFAASPCRITHPS